MKAEKRTQGELRPKETLKAVCSARARNNSSIQAASDVSASFFESRLGFEPTARCCSSGSVHQVRLATQAHG